jgi:hypothetical protein
MATVIVAILLAHAMRVGSAAQVPVRDAGRQPVAATPAGSAIVSGVVVTDETPPRSLRRVTVNLISPDLRVPLSTVTDDSGRFVFAGVPAGTYGLSASRAGWVGAFYGSDRAGRGPGVPLAVREGERVADLVMAMTRGSVIAGTLRLPSGQAAPNMTVFVTGIESTSAGPRLRLIGGRATTDDRGQFRVYGLPEGDYLVQAQPTGFLAGTPSGTTDAPQTTSAEVSWAREVARIRERRASAVPAGPPHGRAMAYATVFYPGTADPSLAEPVTLGKGEERRGVDYAMVLLPTARVSGIVLGPDGLPLPDVRVSLASTADAPDIVALLSPRAPIRTAPDGTFTLPAVPPGPYLVSARRAVDASSAAVPAAPNTVNAAVRTMAAAGGGADRGGGVLWAEQAMVVSGQDLPSLSLQMQPGLSVSGRIVFDAAVLEPPSPEALSEAAVTLIPVPGGGTSMGAAIQSASAGIEGRIAVDGSFIVDGVVPGRYRFSVSMPGVRANPAVPGEGWALRSVMLRDADLADVPLDVDAFGNVTGVVATFSDHPGELVGSLTDAANRPAPHFPIVVFSVDRADWWGGSRRIAVARPATDGAFRLLGLPAGRYYLAAVVDLVPADLDDPLFFEALLPGAMTITIAEGTRTTQDLRLAP